MKRCLWQTIPLAAVSVTVSGCGRPAPSRVAAPPASVAPAPVVAAESESLRTAIQKHGVEVRDIRVALDAGGKRWLGIRVSGKDAVATWERLRAVTERTGFYPLLFHDEHGVVEDMFAFEEGQSSRVLTSADSIRPEAWLKERLEDLQLDGDEKRPLPRSDWPATAAPNTTYTVPTEITSGRYLDELWCLLLPTKSPAEVFALLGYGNWNAYPSAEEHAAIHRRWFEMYGAEIVGMTGDVIEMRVGRPPKSREEAIALAMEHYAYCSDIVDQGTESIDALAATLMNGRVWFFWWD